LLRRRTCPVYGVGLERLPLLAELVHQGVEIVRAQSHQPVVAVLVRRGREALDRELEPGCQPERRQPERVDEYQVGQVPVAAGESCGNGPAHDPADQHRRRRAGPLDKLAEPAEHVLGVERTLWCP
jgi:hypothetical protein